MLKKSILVLMVLFLSVALIGCGSGRKAVQIKGSDTMVNLGQAWTEAFLKQNPKVSIAVTGGGSGTGIAALLSGSTDIAQASQEHGAERNGTGEEKRARPERDPCCQ